MLRMILLMLSMLLLSSCVATAVVGTAAVGSAAFDERSVGTHVDDVAITSKIDARLIQEKDMPSRWVSVQVIEGVATLTGHLPSQEHVDRAIHITRSVQGVVGVKNELHIGEPSTSGILSDSWITTKVKAKLLEDTVVSGFGIHVETVEGKVYLQGVVGSDEQKFRARNIVQNVKGVTAVISLLKVRASK